LFICGFAYQGKAPQETCHRINGSQHVIDGYISIKTEENLATKCRPAIPGLQSRYGGKCNMESVLYPQTHFILDNAVKVWALHQWSQMARTGWSGSLVFARLIIQWVFLGRWRMLYCTSAENSP